MPLACPNECESPKGESVLSPEKGRNNQQPRVKPGVEGRGGLSFPGLAPGAFIVRPIQGR
jgi:hypothetical protein